MQHVPQLAVVRIQLALTLYDSNRVSEAVQVLTRALEECAADQQDQERMARAVKDWSVELLKVSAVSAHVEGS
jgi:predicted Zn-dependent protease